MKDTGIQLRPVSALLTDAVTAGEPALYWIPAYQRGYRWTSLQVTQLLDDIWEFIQQSEGGPRNAFYCLQPLIIKVRPEGGYEVVDGQQRLTTLYILLTSPFKIIESVMTDRSRPTLSRWPHAAHS